MQQYRRGFTQTKEEPKCMVLDLVNLGALFKGPKVGTELNNWRNCCIENREKMERGNPPLDLVLAINRPRALLVLSKILLMAYQGTRLTRSLSTYSREQSLGTCPLGESKKMNRVSSSV